MDNKRKYFRLKQEVIVSYKVSGQEPVREIRALDVGAGGVCLPLSERIKSGTVLELSLLLPNDKEPLVIPAKIAWQTRMVKNKSGRNYYETGVEFLKMDLKDRLQLIHYVHTGIKQSNKAAF